MLPADGRASSVQGFACEVAPATTDGAEHVLHSAVPRLLVAQSSSSGLSQLSTSPGRCTLQVADCPISSLRLQEAGALAAVGCADGATTLLRLCDGLVDAQPAEKQTLAAVRCLSCASVTASLSHTLRGQGSLVYTQAIRITSAQCGVPVVVSKSVGQTLCAAIHTLDQVVLALCPLCAPVRRCWSGKATRRRTWRRLSRRLRPRLGERLQQSLLLLAWVMMLLSLSRYAEQARAAQLALWSR